ncbi:hypothetical protein DL93DRAFT_2162917 [Clavulina sp. PMI_390]|nr:hypothetical protein DL93DRAFT_2162917 [Clavulina sp. PMI_390]
MSTVGPRFVENSTIGPPSQPINIKDFLESAKARNVRIANVLAAFRGEAMELDGEDTVGEYEPIPEDLKAQIEEECRIDDEGAEARRILKNHKLSKFLSFYHEIWRPSQRVVDVKGKKKESPEIPLNEQLKDQEIALAYEVLQSVPLRSWRTPPQASHYIRPVQNSDRNVLTSVRANPLSEGDSNSSIPRRDSHETAVALITYTHYTRSTAKPHPYRLISQHVALSSQTLGDIWDNLPCDHKVLPVPKVADSADAGGAILEYAVPDRHGEGDEDMEDEGDDEEGRGAAIVIHDVVYGDGLSKEDFAEKGPGKVVLKRGGLMHDARLVDLELRLHHPYWCLHQGDCEHMLVFKEIRLPHPTDPSEGYPLTVRRTPSPHPRCQICNANGAEIAIVGDVRLGVNVALLCKGCWKALGLPEETDEEDTVLLVPLLKDSFYGAVGNERGGI